MPPAPPGLNEGNQRSHKKYLATANPDSFVPLPKTQLVNLDALGEDNSNDEDFDSDLVTDERTSCG
jgi:hypothetical protein